MRTLEKLTITNFKSIREQTLELGRLNVFIGGNGAGKSNLIQTFRFLREIVNQNLAGYVGTKGGADALLHFGRKNHRLVKEAKQFIEPFGGIQFLARDLLALLADVSAMATSAELFVRT
jgi:predicted ATPase